MESAYDKLKKELDGLSLDQANQKKKEAFYYRAFQIVEDFAWEDRAHTKPTGISHIASRLQNDLRVTFKDLFEEKLAYEAAQQVASQYY